jgi:hypothetical protein
MDTLTVKPRLAPRSLGDFLMCLPIGVLQATLVFFLPVGLVWYLTGSLGLVALTYLVFVFTWLAWSVTKLELNSHGVRFVRWFGSPKFLSWEEIRAVEVSSPKELILNGWLWPLFPAREMTLSFTARGHYCFRHANGYAYFPPADETVFREFIARHTSHAA